MSMYSWVFISPSLDPSMGMSWPSSALAHPSCNTEQPGQDRLLSMQSVMGLWEDHRMWTIRDIVCQFMVAVSRQAMHDNHILIRFTDQPGIDLVGRENFLAHR